MQTSSSFLKYSKCVLVMVVLVIIAGAVVRMTQSGMGCPDWPKCFGKWIPPTNASELPPDFEKYLKQQDIDHTFNVFHTWTEYINRLLGALLGLFLLIQFAWSLKFWNKKRLVVLLVFGNLLLTGFQAWLGKKVVDANLATVKITTHMLVAMLIAALAYSVISVAQQKEKWVNKKVKYLSIAALVLLVVQIVLGTQVREQIDEISKALAYGGREQWIEKLDVVFYIHRSFSLVLTALCIYLYFLSKKENNNWASKLMLVSVLAEVLLGIIMAYANIPAVAQPLHLLFSTLLFLSLFAQAINTKAQKDLVF
jgi:cytochrome c oxidase assembly protein subunit 15